MANPVITAQESIDGKVSKDRKYPAFTQPIQFLPREEKDQEWCMSNADWLEMVGLRQIIRKAPHFSKNFNLAAGIIDKSDYMGGTTPENKQLLENLMTFEEQSHLDIKFYPFIPTFVNVLCTEFSKRNTKLEFVTADEYSYNEMLSLKQEQITEVLLQEAEQKYMQKIIESGVDINDPAQQENIQQQLSPENLKTLPEIEDYFNKSYRSMIEEWAMHQYREDTYRFRMDELEERNFRNMLITDSCYFHYKMMEDDYDLEIWNPMFTAVFKSPETRYTSDAYGVANVQLMTIPDVIDKHGRFMTEEQMLSLQEIHSQTGVGYDITGYGTGSKYDNTKSHEWNVTGPSVAMREVTSFFEGAESDMVSRLVNQGGQKIAGEPYFVRTSTMYWKSQRRIGHLTRIKRNGQFVTDIVDEEYTVTDHPVYNTTLLDVRNAETLIFGEHIEWIWINQTWGVVKIGPNTPTYWGMPVVAGTSSFQPMYIGINQNKVAPVRYQFKGDKDLYGCKLPVEGASFSDYNTRSTCAVDILKPYQISYNVVNNQISDILMDELGTVITLDPNQIPQQSLGEDWGKQNYAKAYVAMKNFSILPLDRKLANTEGAASSNAEARVLDLEQSNRLRSRIDLAVYFKNEGLSQVGITPNRLGQPTGRQTASGQEENINASYTQTEKYFTQFSDYLMPRVHQMRTDLAQFYQSSNPSVRLRYLTSKDERVNFQINGLDLLMRHINVYLTSSTSTRNVVEELKKLLITNNTAGGTIYQLGSLLTADSLGEINNILKKIEKQAQNTQQQELSQAQQLQQMKDASRQKELQLLWDHEAREAEKERRNDIVVAEIRASGYSGAVDLNANNQNDFMDNLDRIQGQTEFQDTMNMKRTTETNKLDIANRKLQLDREKIDAMLEGKRMDLDIARENQTKSELEAKRKSDQKAREAKRNKK